MPCYEWERWKESKERPNLYYRMGRDPKTNKVRLQYKRGKRGKVTEGKT